MAPSPSLSALNPPEVRVAVLIRFADSAATLPGVLRALERQTRRPDRILGISNRSTDGSGELVRAAGGVVLDWPHPYQPAKVLNFGLAECATDLVCVLSSHTTLVSPDALERLVAAVCEAGTACASAGWHLTQPAERVTWSDLEQRGLPYSSIYSNSCGILRHECWRNRPFLAAAGIVEDYEWALAQLRRGHRCQRLRLDFRYERPGPIRYFSFARHLAALAHCQGLRFTEAPFSYTVRQMSAGVVHALKHPRAWKTGYAIGRQGLEILLGRLTWWPLAWRMRRDPLSAGGRPAGS